MACFGCAATNALIASSIARYPGSALTPVKMKLRSLISASARSSAATFAASVSGLAGDYGLGPYNAAKAAVVNITRVFAMEYARKTAKDVLATAYILDGYEGGLPTSWYLNELATAAEQAGAPEDYVKKLRDRPTRSSTL